MAGVTLNDKKLAAEVRTLTLREIKKYLSSDGTDAEAETYKKQLILRLAPTVLPRINEHMGEDGEPIRFNLMNYGHLGSAVPVPTPSIPTADPASPAEVQDSSVASPGGEI